MLRWGMAKIKIYTTPSCVYCKMAKAYFTEHNTQYEELNVTNDARLQQEMIQKSGQMGVPVIDIDGKIIVGFDKSKIAELISAK